MVKKISELGFLSVGSQMRRIYEKLQLGGDKIYAAAGIQFKSSWFPIYYTLSTSHKSLSIMEITEQISYSRITVKNIIKELSSAQLVDVKINPADSRSKLVSLTTKGKKLAPKLEPLWNSFSRELTKVFGSDYFDFMNQLTSVNASLEELSFEKRVLSDYFNFSLRKAKKEELKTVGKLLVNVYSKLKGFPTQEDQPKYYKLLGNVGRLTQNKNIELLVAASELGNIGAAVVYFKHMKDYGSGGSATKEKKASGFRLLAVDPDFRGLGLGKLLTVACIDKAKKSGSEQVIIHTTKAMKVAWTMYEKLGFKRSRDLDFMQGDLPVFGFRLKF